MGICAIFDVTGARVFQLVRAGLPEAPPPGSRPDPFLAAMETIMAARREVAPLSEPAAAEGAGQALAAGASAEGADQRLASAAAEGAVAATAQKIGVTLPA